MATYWQTLNKFLPLIAVIAVALATTATHAALAITSVIGGAPTGVYYANFDNLPLGNGGGVSGGINVSFTGTGQVVQGSSATYAAPYLSNSNGVLFGDPTVSGPDTTSYISIGNSGSATLTLPGGELYLGLLWGSVDAGTLNTLTFLDSSGNSVGSIDGPDVTASASGNQGASGTYYVNITSTVPFTKVLVNGQVFEFDNVSYNPTVPVPEPSTALLISGSAGVILRRRKRVN